jgi:hypothetical protein
MEAAIAFTGSFLYVQAQIPPASSLCNCMTWNVRGGLAQCGMIYVGEPEAEA